MNEDLKHLIEAGRQKIAAEQRRQEEQEAAKQANRKRLAAEAVQYLISIMPHEVQPSAHPWIYAGSLYIRIPLDDTRAIARRVNYKSAPDDTGVEHVTDAWFSDYNQWHVIAWRWDDITDQATETLISLQTTNLLVAMARAMDMENLIATPEQALEEAKRKRREMEAPALYESLRADIEAAAWHYDHGNTSQAKSRVFIVIASALVDIADSLASERCR